MTGLLFVLSGLASGTVLAIFPSLAMWAMLIMSLVVVGTVIYFFPVFGEIRWAVPLISLALLCRSILEHVTRRSNTRGFPPLFLMGFFLIGLSVLLTTAINLKLKETLIASKDFFQFWSIPIAFYVIDINRNDVGRMMKCILVIAAIQPPVAVVQNFFFTSPSGLFPGDSVTGTFGGQIAGGGPNAALSVFLAIQTAIVLSMAVQKLLAWPRAILLVLWLSIPLFLTHAKISVLYFPIVFLFLFAPELLRRPVISLAGFLLVSVLTVGVLSYHYNHAWQYSASRKQPKNLQEYFQQSVSPNVRIEGGNKLSRVGSIVFWWKEHSFKTNPAQMLVGHGVGAAKHDGLIQGHLTNQLKYRSKRIGMTALPRLLWDVGLIGASIYVGIFVTAFLAASRMKKNPHLPSRDQPYMFGAQIACLLFLISLPYKLSIISTQAFNAYSMFVLGYIAYWHRQLSLAKDKKA